MTEPLVSTGELLGGERAELTAEETPDETPAMSDTGRQARARPLGTLAGRWEVRQAELRAEAAAHPEDRAEAERLAYERADAAREYPFSGGAPVEAQVSAGPMTSYTVRFDPDSIDALQERAAADGVGVAQMLRGWVLERLAGDGRLAAGAVDEFGPTSSPDVNLDTEEIVLRGGRRLTDEPAKPTAAGVADMRTGQAER